MSSCTTFSPAESSVVLCLAQYFNILSETHAFLPCLNNAIQLVFPYPSRFPYTKNNLPSCCTIRTFVQFQPLILASLCIPRISHFREMLPIPHTYVYNMAFSCVEMTQVTHYYLQLAKNTHSLDWMTFFFVVFFTTIVEENWLIWGLGTFFRKPLENANGALLSS